MNLRSRFGEPDPTPAVVLAEGEFGEPGGKTAHGVVMHSELFEAAVVVDSGTAGTTADEVLENPSVDPIPVVASVADALERAPEAEALVIGVAPAGGDLPESWVDGIRAAMRAGCDVVSGLHVFLSEREEWTEFAAETGVDLYDVRKPPAEDDLRVADGSVDEVDADVVLTTGTDCAVGKRTTAFELYRAARRVGRDAAWVATGQTGIMVGAHRGVVIDRVPADFAAGVVEDLVTDVAADHEIVFVEGQASLAHRAYSGVTLSILHGCWPDAAVVADDPGRSDRTHYEQWPVAGLEREVDLIERLSDATVAGVSTWGDPDEASARDLPAANVYREGGPARLLEAVTDAL
ncbi:Uncharacterized conserved protein, NAD-dependent epimerase/dehydratase family [Halobiforma haloterrestris]|uniref:Uncharacterized conserved protein, NAD-dependent epimerase/dehydratase family n=1 Tax=Natronobacterium haloterrestre TaxID=148448 RepID=A0A1I1D6A0_NATHA|nr:DUF1611 domain-containing protein [Halobiforma haloterrestris]SFB68320.1 Uncharacterized conserved protein, NAD-dependent epimerase/dehydratase family [Halobiforma haloterrestris]